MDKNSSPYLNLSDGGSIDFLFELMLPKERREVIEDFFRGEKIKMPSKKDLQDIHKPVDMPVTVNKDDVKDADDPHTFDFLKLWTSGGKEKPDEPKLEYDESHHRYVKIADTFLKDYMKLYVDMDGVLTDFEAAVRELGPEAVPGLKDDATSEEKQKMYDMIEKAGPGFWSNMPWKEGGMGIWKAVRPFYPRLLSSPGKFMHAERGKNEWVKKNLPGVPLFLENDKYRWAERGAVLIDDSIDNIHGWRMSGGVGIHHKDPKNTEIKLLSLLAPPDGC